MQANEDFVASTPAPHYWQDLVGEMMGNWEDQQLNQATYSQPCGWFVDKIQVSHLKVIVSIVNWNYML